MLNFGLVLHLRVTKDADNAAVFILVITSLSVISAGLPWSLVVSLGL